MSAIIAQFLDHMDSCAEESSRPMDLDKFFTFTAFDLVGEALCGKPFGFLKEGKDFNNAIATNLFFQKIIAPASRLRELHYIVINPIMTWLSFTPASWIGETAFAAVKYQIARPVERFDMLSHWLKYKDQNPDKVSMRDIMAQATNVTAAGSDTTSGMLQSVFYHLIRNPETLARAREEIDQLPRDVLDQRVIPFSAVRELPYLQACMKEALWIFCPIPMTLPRISPKGGIEIGGRWFPGGVTLSGSAWVLHRSRAVWGPDVDEFKPERWLGDNAAQLEKCFMPFGAGYNSCPGQHLARMEVSKITATILRDYDLWLVDPEKEWEFKMFFAQVPHSWPFYVSKRRKT